MRAVQGPYRVSELRSLLAEGNITPQTLVTGGVVESYVEEDAAKVQVDTGKWRPLEAVPQLRWQLVAKGSLPATPAEHAGVALRVLTRMVTMHQAVDSRGVPYHPIPFGKRVVSAPDCLAVLAQLMLSNIPQIVEGSARLLAELMAHNPLANSKLYLTGVFHFCMAYTGSNLSVVARLLHLTHLQQNFRDAANAVAAELSLQRRSILGEMLPEAMLHVLENYGPQRFAQVFVGDLDTPEVIWNPEMRRHLVAMVLQHLGDFPLSLKQNMQARYEYCPIPGVAYASLAREVFCHNYYLRNLCDTKRFPKWPITDPVALFKSVLEQWKLELSKKQEEGQASLDEALDVMGLTPQQLSEPELRKVYRKLARQYHPDKNPQGRDMFEKIQQVRRLRGGKGGGWRREVVQGKPCS